jgi:RNA polymerase sigma-70 factor (ECF subfamily)
MADEPNDSSNWSNAASSFQSPAGVPCASANEVGELIEGCRQYLLVIAEAELGNDLRVKAGASDLVQETFLEAQRAFDQFHGDSRDELLAWLRQILLHRLAKLGRCYRRTQKRELSRECQPLESSQALLNYLYDSEATTPSGHAAKTEQSAIVQQALDRLSPDYRTVVLLRHRDHLKFSEIAARLDRSADAVRMLWCRAINRLAQELEAYDE